MPAKRIIACLDVKDGRVVKGVRFVNLRDAGDPADLAAAYSEVGIDEVVFLDITASAEGRGLMVGIELVQDPETRRPFDSADRIGHLVCMALRKRGVILRPLGDVVVVLPPLSITEPEIDRMIDAVRECIEEVTGA